MHPRQIARHAGVESQGFQGVKKLEGPLLVPVACQDGGQVLPIGPVAALRPLMHRHGLVEPEVLGLARKAGDHRGKKQRIGVGTGGLRRLELQPPTAQALHEGLQDASDLVKAESARLCARLPGELLHLAQRRDARVQPAGIECIHGLDNPRLGGLLVHRRERLGCVSRNLIGHFRVGAGGDLRPAEHELLRRAIESGQPPRGLGGGAPRGQGRIQVHIQARLDLPGIEGR